MDPHGQLHDQIAPPGSNLHYSLLFASPGARGPLGAVAAWQQEARLLAFAPRERHTTLTRIDWWQEEALRLRLGAPRHPVTQALAGSGAAHPGCAGEHLERMLERVQHLVRQERVMHEEELWQHCDALGSEGERMIADALAPPNRESPRVLDGLGEGLEMLELTRPPSGHRHFTPRMVPLAHDAALGDGTGTRGHDGCNPALRALLQGRCERAERLLRAALGRVADHAVSPERSRVVLARLALAQLRVLARQQYRRWNTGPSPLRKLVIAWNAARRCP